MSDNHIHYNNNNSITNSSLSPDRASSPAATVAAAPHTTSDNILGSKVSAFLDRVTGAANAVIDGTTLTGAIVTPVSVDALRQDFVLSSKSSSTDGGHGGGTSSGNRLRSGSTTSSTNTNPTTTQYSPMPWVVKGPYVSVHQQPIRAFTAATAMSIHGNTRGADFDVAYKNAIESQRLLQSAQNHLGVIASKEAARHHHQQQQRHATSSPTTSGGDEKKDDDDVNSQSPDNTFSPAPSSVNGVLQKRLSALCENNGVCRSQMTANAIRCKKMAERGEEALTAAMSRGLLRRQNDAVGYLGRQQTVGDINDLDVAAVDRERADIAKIMAHQHVQNEMAVEQYHKAHNAKMNR